MRRRSILTSMSVTAAVGLSVHACNDGGSGQVMSVDSTQQAPGVVPEVRTTVPLMENWRFLRSNRLSDEEALASNAADWQVVTLPHTWNAEDAASLQAPEDYERGIGWYRLELPPPAATGGRHWLEFGAASLVADVWLNGVKLGQHRGGFTQFRFDVTDALRADRPNVLLVKVDNRNPEESDDPTAIDPFGGDYNKSGGLYRHVALVSTPAPAHFDLADLGGPGVYAATTSLAGGTASVNVRTKLKSDAAEQGDFVVRVSLVDDTGRSVATVERPVQLAGGANTELGQDLTVPGPRLWQGVEDPYRYQLVADLVDSGGQSVDRVISQFGIREIRIDPDQGFFLNGRPLRLHGIAMHQDFLGKAWATTNQDVDLSFSLIKEIGANAVRFGHYPFSQYAVGKADELGLVAWVEKPSGLRPTPDRCTAAPPDPRYLANAREQLQETIRQNFNHPSVAMWSIGNETEAGQIFCGDANDNVTAYLEDLNAVASVEDPTRPTANAEFSFGGAFTGGELPFTTAGITDVLGTNRYYLWYNLDYDEFPGLLDDLRAEHPEQALGISEYGAGAALTHHTDNVLGGPPEVRSADEGETSYQPEEYAAYVHEQAWRVIASKSYLWGSFIWNMFDFGSAHRNEGDLLGVNTKGVVTFDRQTRKDPFFFYKANWSTEPVTYIVGRRYTDRAYPATDVRVYSNADSVRLLVNDQPVGARSAAECDQKTCIFPGVRLNRGANRVTAIGDHAGRQVIDTVDWAWNTQDINILAGRLATGFVASTGMRFGSDHFFTGGEAEYIERGDDAEGGPPEDVEGTNDPELFKYFREGERFSYAIPLADGRYEITLGFIEPDEDASRGERVFTVTANGRPLLEDFDVTEEAGGPRTGVTRTFTVDVTGGQLSLEFASTEGDALVSNIAIQSAGPATPVASGPPAP